MVEKERIQAANLGRRRNRGSNLERDKRKQRIVIGLAIVAVLLVIAIPLYGWVTTFILPPRETIVRVNDTSYDMAYLLKLMRMVQRQTETQGQPVNLGTIPFQLVQDLATNELIVQGAQGLGLTVTDEEVDAELRRQFLAGATEGASQADLEIEFREVYRQFLNQVRLSSGEYKEVVARGLYRQKLEEYLAAAIPAELPQVHLYALALPSTEDAEEARTKFARGSTFAELVEEYSQNSEELRREGEVDWVPRDVLEERIADYVFDELPVGEISEPISQFDPNTNQEVLILYYVPERADLRQVSEDNFESLKAKAVADWVTEQRKTNDVTTSFDSNQYAWLADKLRLSTSLQ